MNPDDGVNCYTLASHELTPEQRALLVGDKARMQGYYIGPNI